MPKQATPKYRPVLTPAQILHILRLAKTESPISDISMSLIATLSPFQAKIENAGIQAAYVTSPRKDTTSLEALGGIPETPEITTSEKVDKAAYWEECYNAFIANPESCSLAQIQAAKEHMYLNDLMTPEEVAEFEANN